ncbi:hypothetical protein [Bythopirellula polymerisocia]|uniref:Uncharacterized protein n=1 Tax=Bythopirellula polymerisocia TaxID=2528003 RepID=A0A5C6D366_9BACT|nr:hypothetical protein [Bythopirellula polymerisocia]TWU30221.1 hypothetical protein Pla144_10070 [Bythopirellula polymerisocia]
MSIAEATVGQGQPLSNSQQQEVANASQRARKIRSAAGVAKFNAWSTGILGACSIPFAFGSLSGLFVAIGLAIVAYNEFRGRRLLLKFDPRGPTLLGWNQLGFLALIIVYCVWMLVTGLTGPSSFAAELQANPELREVLGSGAELEGVYKLVVVGVYGSVIVLSIIYQGANAYYYFSRRKYLTAYLRDTPEWVINLQRLTAGGWTGTTSP